MKRLYYLDNLRIFLTILVIVFHTSIAYGGAGSWYYKDINKNNGITPTMIVFTIFTAVCQAFFMSLFFFISAYFTPGSFDRKGPLTFIVDRLIRLGVPLAVFYFLIDPPLTWFLHFRKFETLSTFYHQIVFGFKKTFFGPTWFIETLIFFTIIYTVIRLITQKKSEKKRQLAFPNGKTLFISAVLFGAISFFVRLKYPTGTGPLELQLGYFPLYILMMVIGIVAYRNDWLDQVPTRVTKVWKGVAI